MKKKSLIKWQRRRTLKERCVEYLGGKCIDCGWNEIGALEFHHTNEQTKEFEISLGITSEYSWEKLRPELDKCLLYCSNHHKLYHWDLHKDINETIIEEQIERP